MGEQNILQLMGLALDVGEFLLLVHGAEAELEGGGEVLLGGGGL